ncbi:MAG TPA: bacterial transcriptional activator domain-containing protein [Mycobacteriales bacterium]|nr:bacterial transcriptional activator domain-containing protein [Mycobacteriales bacterium]
MSQAHRAATLARQALAAGDLARADHLLTDTSGTDAVARAGLLRVRAQLALSGSGNALVQCRAISAEATELAAECPLPAALSLADAASLALCGHEPQLALTLLSRAGELAADEPEATRYVSLVHALVQAFLGNADGALATLKPILEPVERAEAIGDWLQHVRATALTLGVLERYDLCQQLTRRAVTAARDVGSTGFLPLLLNLQSNAAFLAGDHATALLAALEAQDLAEATGQAAMVAFGSCCAALVEAVRGHDASVKRHLARARAGIPDTGMEVLVTMSDVAEGLLGLSTEDVEGSVAAYQRVEERLARIGNRSSVLQWRADQIEALWRADRRHEAGVRLAAFDEQLRQSPLPWSSRLAAKCHGLLDAEGWTAQFEAAVAAHPPVLPAFERGRAYLLWAERLNAQGRAGEAATRAAEAGKCFDDCGAVIWSRRARQICDGRAAGLTPQSGVALRVRTLGDFALEQHGRPLPIKHGVPAQALKLFVAFGGQIHLEQLAEALWPGVPADEGRARLRNVVARIRSQLGPVLRRDADVLVLDADTDVREFERLAQMALTAARGDPSATERAVEALRLYCGEFLPADRYNPAMVATRERLHRIFLALLDRLADESAHRGDPVEAVRWLERGIAAERYDDTRHLRAADLLLASGHHPAAVEMLNRARQVAVELDVSPSPRLLEMECRLRRRLPD